MRGISTTLVIIVTAIVILVAALVVLTIFGGGIEPIVDITTKENLCMTEYGTLCAAGAIKGNEKPPTWNVQVRVSVGGQNFEMRSCAQLVECSCTDNVASCTRK